VDAVAEQILTLDNNIADMNADTEAHLLFLGEGLLNRDRALHSVDGTGEIGDDTIAGTAEDPPAMGRDALVDNGATGGQPAHRANLVVTQQLALARNTGSEDRRQLAERFSSLAHLADKPDPSVVGGADKALLPPRCRPARCARH